MGGKSRIYFADNGRIADTASGQKELIEGVEVEVLPPVRVWFGRITDTAGNGKPTK